MPRFLRISGILLFAALIGFATSRLYEQYDAGTLFERYNSQRKADITLLAVSICGFATIGFFGFVRPRRRLEQPGFGVMAIKKELEGQEPVVDAPGSTNIYAAPEAIDEWQGPGRMRVMKPRMSFEISGLWIRLLRVYCGVLPVIYLYTLVNYLFFWLPSGAGNLVLSILFPVLFLGSVLASIGILRRKKWGLKFGYAMAIFHLLVFPVGTAAGLVMMVGLMGASSEFTLPKRRHLGKARKTKRRKPQPSVL